MTGAGVRGLFRLAGTAVLAATVTAQAAGPSTVYRCGNSYSQTPCEGAATVAADDERTPAQRAQTLEAARRDAAQARALEKARLAQEARAPRAVVIPSGTGNLVAEVAPVATARDGASASARPHARHPRPAASNGLFTARAPAAPRPEAARAAP